MTLPLILANQYGQVFIFNIVFACPIKKSPERKTFNSSNTRTEKGKLGTAPEIIGTGKAK